MTMTVWVATLHIYILTHHLVLNVNSIQLEKETLHSFSSLSVGDTPLLREWLAKKSSPRKPNSESVHSTTENSLKEHSYLIMMMMIAHKKYLYLFTKSPTVALLLGVTPSRN